MKVYFLLAELAVVDIVEYLQCQLSAKILLPAIPRLMMAFWKRCQHLWLACHLRTSGRAAHGENSNAACLMRSLVLERYILPYCQHMNELPTALTSNGFDWSKDLVLHAT